MRAVIAPISVIRRIRVEKRKTFASVLPPCAELSMPAFDAGFKIITRISGRQLAGLALAPVDDWAPLVTEVQTTERFADRAFRARQGRERFVVYFEAYTYWKKEAPWNLLTKSALLSERERLPTVCLVYILRPRGYRPQGGQFQLAVKDKTTQYLRLHEVSLWE